MMPRNHLLARRVRALRTDAALRDAEGVLVAEGVHLAKDALDAGADIEAAITSSRLLESDEGRLIARRLDEAGVRALQTSEVVLDGLQDSRSPQPVVLIVRRTPVELAAVIDGRGGTPLLVVACGVQDPGNLGALWRTADAAGATGFVSAPRGASLTHPRTVRASMGSIFRLAAVEMGLLECLDEVHRRRFKVAGAIARGAADYDTIDWAGPMALLVGGEGAGLPDEALKRLDLCVGIRMAPGVESLSVNAAAAVLLFEAAKKRRSISRA